MRPRGLDQSVLVAAAVTAISANSATKWIVVTLVKATDVIAVVTCISELHPRAEGTDGRKIFDDEADGLGRRGKATMTKPRPRTALAPCREQFGR
jgi:hypothetical protein